MQASRRSAAKRSDQDTPQRILAAATRLMSEHGYDGTSAQEVADAAGVNKALVFYYFRSKLNLFEQVLTHYLEGLHAALVAASEALDDDAPRSGCLHAILDAYIDFVEANPGYPRVIQLELAHADGRHDLIGRYNRRNFKVIEPYLKFPREDPSRSPEQFFVSFGGMVLHYFVSAPVLAPVLSSKRPMSPTALEIRRQHIHWMVDAGLAALSS